MKAWILGFAAGLVVTLLTIVALLLSVNLTTEELIFISVSVFIFTFLIIGLLLELLFFRHIKAIYEMIDKIEREDFSDSDLSVSPNLNPLLRINQEFRRYVSGKQEEIKRLKELAKFRREFIADISHELKTPLFAAQGFVHTLIDGAVKDKNVRDKFLKNAARSLDGLDLLVRDLLTISQIESGDIKMHFESFDIIALAVKVIDQMETKADKKGLRILIENEEYEKVFVHADYRRMHQVFANLISNAIKYSKDESDIFLRFEEQDLDVRCAIIDRGVGIAAEDKSRIFERFFRVDKSRSKGGTGLGLAIVKHIMEGHDSQVLVESQLNKGSTFSFLLLKGNPTENVEHDEY